MKCPECGFDEGLLKSGKSLHQYIHAKGQADVMGKIGYSCLLTVGARVDKAIEEYHAYLERYVSMLKILVDAKPLTSDCPKCAKDWEACTCIQEIWSALGMKDADIA